METFDGGKRMKREQEKFLRGLAKQYPTISAAASEIINLQAILSLPKGTEHFITDVPGNTTSFSILSRMDPGPSAGRLRRSSGPPSARQRRRRWPR